MEEKYNGIWLNVQQDDSAKLVYEEHLSSVDKLQAIYKRADGNFQPYSCIKKSDHQWRLPIWVPENTKAVLPSLESAKEYLSAYV